MDTTTIKIMANENLIKYSLKAEIVEKLRGLAIENESPSLVAKRFLLEKLGYSPENSTPEEKSSDRPSHDSLEEIRDRLDDHETRLKALEDPDHPIVRFLSKALKEE